MNLFSTIVSLNLFFFTLLNVICFELFFFASKIQRVSSTLNESSHYTGVYSASKMFCAVVNETELYTSTLVTPCIHFHFSSSSSLFYFKKFIDFFLEIIKTPVMSKQNCQQI